MNQQAVDVRLVRLVLRLLFGHRVGRPVEAGALLNVAVGEKKVVGQHRCQPRFSLGF
jgi:hypothetical protein